MGSEGSKMSDSTDCTGFQPSETKLCPNECGFFGVVATMNLGSKCYRDFRITEEHAALAKVVMDKLVDGFRVEIRAGSSSSAGNDPPSSTEGTNSVKLVNGVAVVLGRTRSLVERFERRERLNGDEVQAHDTTAHIITETAKTTPMLRSQKSRMIVN
ncbi:unnamed protein product [Camellia sinensis]